MIIMCFEIVWKIMMYYVQIKESSVLIINFGPVFFLNNKKI
jgi:hypothetical protein